MNTAIANTVAAANDKAQYDEYAKRLIAQKIILDKMRLTPNIIFPAKHLLKSLLKTGAKAVPAL